jgi:hypothetical protein
VFGTTKGADYVDVAFDWHFDGRQNYSAVQERWNSLNKNITTTIDNIDIRTGDFHFTDNEKVDGFITNTVGNRI